MSRDYWLDLFTGETWEEFLSSGASVSGFRESRKKTAQSIKPGDYFICYLTGVSRFISVLEVESNCFIDSARIWKREIFPVRFKVRLLHKLEPETAIPLNEFRNKPSLFMKLNSWNAWGGFLRGSPAKFDARDGKIILDAIIHATKNPVRREFDAKKYWHRPKTYKSKAVGKVTVPEDTEAKEIVALTEVKRTIHEEIQLLLLELGSKLGLDVWVARNDRNKGFEGRLFRDIEGLRTTLPRQFDDATNRTIELIDVLWLQGDAIVAAFEVEHSTSIYSGLLRMSDLVSMQPNIKLNLYLVAPDERRGNVYREINRPTFAKLEPPLPRICKFIPYSKLKDEIEQLGPRIKFVKPDFVDAIAESCEAIE